MCARNKLCCAEKEGTCYARYTPAALASAEHSVTCLPSAAIRWQNQAIVKRVFWSFNQPGVTGIFPDAASPQGGGGWRGAGLEGTRDAVPGDCRESKKKSVTMEVEVEK